MRIAVNTRFLLKGKLEGIGYFTYETLRLITKQHPEHEFIFIFDRPFDPAFVFSSNVTPVVAPPPARHPLLWYLWFEWSVPYILRKHKADFFLSTDGYLSLSAKVPSVPVMHDLAFEHYPKDVGTLISQYYRHYFPKYAKKATRIATVSTYSKEDIASRYGIDPGLIDVVYNGASEVFRPLSAEEISEVRLSYSQGKPYFIYVGALHQRKNISRLLKAFDRFKQDPSDLKLLIVGRKAWGNAEMESIYAEMDHKDDVIFTGRVSQKALAQLLGAAHALTYVSYFEGFGIPIVEAMRCHIPVVVSNTSSIPEVAGDAGITVDPHSVESIYKGLHACAFDKELYERKKAQSIERSHVFSWERSANLLWQCIERAIQQ